MRSVTVDVPDLDEAESTVRRVAFQLREGCNVAVIPLPPPLGMEHALLVAEIVEPARQRLRLLAETVR